MLAGNGLGITGAASTVARDNLPKNIIVVSNDKGKISASPISIHELQTSISGGATTITDNDLTPNKVVISNADGKVSTSSVSSAEVGYLAGTNDLIQIQLNSKANQLTTYTKSEVDNNLLLKADKSEVDNNLLLKADKLTTYTKTEVDNKLLNDIRVTTQLTAISLLDLYNNISYLELGINESAFGDITCNSLTVGTPSIHSLTNTSVTFGTPVTCQYDLTCATLTASSIYGGASIQIQQNIDNAIAAAALSTQLPLSINNNVLSIDLSSYATTSSTYTATVIDDKLLLKANKSTTYTKTEVDNSLLLKANKSTTYTNTEVDDKLLNSIRASLPLTTTTFSDLQNPNNNYVEISINDSEYAKTSTTYTKTEVDDQMASKQPVFTALDPVQEGFDLSDLNNPVLTLGLKQTFIDTVNGKQDAIDNTVDLTCKSLGIASNTHNLTDTSVTFGTPVTCQYDLSCSTLTASSIYGGASTQIMNAINSAVSTKQDTIDSNANLNVNTLTSSSDVVINGNIRSNDGLTSVSVSKAVPANTTDWFIQLTRFNGAVCGQVFVTCSTGSFSVAKVYSIARQYNANAVITLHSDTGAFQNNDFSLVNVSQDKHFVLLGIINNCSFSANITATFMIGGHSESLSITTY